MSIEQLFILLKDKNITYTICDNENIEVYIHSQIFRVHHEEDEIYPLVLASEYIPVDEEVFISMLKS